MNEVQKSRPKHPSRDYVERSNRVAHYQIKTQLLENPRVSFDAMFIQLPFYQRMLYTLWTRQ